ncbi:alcohol dehydrogenase [Microbotryomycetes sp. JL221]|nr:alcohol dehydrogenase [Microbotryomycetes sp. JL221]
MSQQSETVWKGYAIHDIKKPTEFKVIDFEPKRAGDYDIDIEITCCGICASDVHTITGGWSEDIIIPMITGHEVAGRVARVGPKVTEFKSDNENYCVTGGVDTYNAKYENGDIAHGGYATAIRAHERFVFKLPDGLSDEDAAPMLCGGLTVYGPLKNYGVGKGTKLGLLGLGGLGHFAVMFANALGAEVTVLSHSADKEDDARKMGAKHFINTSEKDFAKGHEHEFDIILSTVDAATAIALADYFPLLKLHGRFHSVGLPNDAVEINFMSMAGNAANLSVSHIGSKKQAQEMLQLAADKGLKTWKEILPMQEAGKGVQNLLDNKVRYRSVLMQDITKSA